MVDVGIRSDRRFLRRLGRVTLAPMLLLVTTMGTVAQTVVVAVLPPLQAELGISRTDATWILTVSLLSTSVVAPIAGRLGDMFGYSRMLLFCLGCFVAGSLISGIAMQARDLWPLLAGRVLQGISGGMVPLAFGLTRGAVPQRHRANVIALLSSTLGIGAAVSMVLGGLIVDSWGSPWLFWAMIVPVIPALVLLPFGPEISKRERNHIDLLGALLLSVALICLLLVISQGEAWGWLSLRIIVLTIGCVAASVAFVVSELHEKQPLVSLPLLRRRAFAMTNLEAFVIGVCMLGALSLIPSFLQSPSSGGYGFSMSPTAAGVVFIPIAAAMALIGPLANRFGFGINSTFSLRGGLLITGAALGLLSLDHSHLWQFYLGGLMIGCGYGLVFASLGNLLLTAVEPERTGLATGLTAVVRMVAGAIGSQLVAAILTASGQSHPTETGYRYGFGAVTALALIALAIALAIPARWHRTSPGESDRSFPTVGILPHAKGAAG